MAAERDLEYELRPGGLNDLDARAYWAERLHERGMGWPQIDVLLDQAGVRFHELLEMLDAGCPPEVAFDIASE